MSGPAAGRLLIPDVRPEPLARPRPRLRPVAPAGGELARGALARLRALPDHALVDRLVRGRLWIPLLGMMLAGIVAMQVETLKLGASLGRWVERTSAVASRNAELRASVASLADGRRIERLAAGMGMMMPEPTQLQFLALRPGGEVARALAGIRAPDPARFLASLPASSPSVLPGSGLATALAPTASQAVPSTTAASTDQAAVTDGAGTAPMPSAAQAGQGAAGASPAGVPSGVAGQNGVGTPSGAAGQYSAGATSSSPAARTNPGSTSATAPATGAPTGAAGLPGGQASGG